MYNEFLKEDRFVLNLIGITMNEKGIILSKQRKKKKPISFIAYKDIKKITLQKTNDRDIDFWTVLSMFQSYFESGDYPSLFYRLSIHTESKGVQECLVSNFDLIRVNRILGQFNNLL